MPLPRRRVDPGGAGGQVDIAGPGARLKDRGDEQVGAEQELVLDVPGARVVREVHEQRPHRGKPGPRRHAHLLVDVRPQPLAQPQGRGDPLVGGIAVGPRLVRAAGHLVTGGHAGQPVAVQPEERATSAAAV